MEKSEFNGIIDDVINLLETRGWTQGASARNALGDKVHPNVEWATCFCLFGAIYRVTDIMGNSDEFYDEMYNRVKISREHASIISYLIEFNDCPDRKKEEVIQLLKEIRDEV